MYKREWEQGKGSIRKEFAQAYLGDMAGLVADHLNKVNSARKRVT